MKVIVGFLFGLIAAMFWFGVHIPHQNRGHTFLVEKDEESYVVNMRSMTPIVGISHNPFPHVFAVMTEEGTLNVTTLLTPKTRVVCVMIVPRENTFSPDRFSDEHGQVWTRAEGRDPLLGHCYWGTISIDGTDVYFNESPYQGGNPLAVWKLVSKTL